MLESGESLQLPIEGQIYGVRVSLLEPCRKDGTIEDDSGEIIGHVELTIGTYHASGSKLYLRTEPNWIC